MTLAFPPFGTMLPPIPITGITIDASTWRWDGTSGSVLVSSGFPLKPSQVNAANLAQVRVYVNSVEQAVALHPLEGSWPDGSYRSLGIQYTYNLTNDTPVTAQIKINQGTRGTSDNAWVEPVRATHVMKRAVIAPTDPVHLCGTLVTLMPLTPASNDSGAGATWAAWAVSQWASSGVANGNIPGTAIYDHQNGLWAMYCRTGTRSWYQAAYDWCIALQNEFSSSGIVDGAGHGDYLLLLPYIMPTDPASPFCTNASIWDPENLVGVNSSCGSRSEALSTRNYSLASAYWMTAWRQPKRQLAIYCNFALYGTATGYTTARDIWIDPNWGIRLNLHFRGLSALLAGYLTECTTSMAFPGGYPAASSWDYATYLPWIIDALEYYTWALGDYRDGLVGMRSTTIGGPGETYGITTFQLSLIGEFLMVYYDNIKPDSRIPGMMTKLADYIIGQSRQSVATDVGYPLTWVTSYNNTTPPQKLYEDLTTGIGTNSTSNSQPLHGWYLAMFPSIFAWVAKQTGNATYMTWADRAAVTENSNLGSGFFQTKNWGEYFGGTRQSYLYYRAGGTVRGTPGAHPTGIVNPPVHATLG